MAVPAQLTFHAVWHRQTDRDCNALSLVGSSDICELSSASHSHVTYPRRVALIKLTRHGRLQVER